VLLCTLEHQAQRRTGLRAGSKMASPAGVDGRRVVLHKVVGDVEADELEEHFRKDGGDGHGPRVHPPEWRPRPSDSAQIA
jgi:hypothetical protein